mmetsp:Transcript_3018/g.9095  ORF Transcript_3018/g.9095 Transcript_3018/m.9095 type:complete len:289 (-) Transcript_3018:9-875(-)
MPLLPPARVPLLERLRRRGARRPPRRQHDDDKGERRDGQVRRPPLGRRRGVRRGRVRAEPLPDALPVPLHHHLARTRLRRALLARGRAALLRGAVHDHRLRGLHGHLGRHLGQRRAQREGGPPAPPDGALLRRRPRYPRWPLRALLGRAAVPRQRRGRRAQRAGGARRREAAAAGGLQEGSQAARRRGRRDGEGRGRAQRCSAPLCGGGRRRARVDALAVAGGAARRLVQRRGMKARGPCERGVGSDCVSHDGVQAARVRRPRGTTGHGSSAGSPVVVFICVSCTFHA